MVISTLLLDWHEKHGNSPSHHRTFAVNSQKMVKLGRDPMQCDLVIAHPTVSRLHAVIFFCQDPHPINATQPKQGFYLRNLTDHHNSPIVDGKKVDLIDVPLQLHSTINLGMVRLEVSQIHLAPTNEHYGLICPNPACQYVISAASSIPICGKCGRSLAGAMRVVISP
ncbi:MAG: FHA domain-containing protein [Pseudanabaena sp. ELA607]|jgi:hypothetical protein